MHYVIYQIQNNINGKIYVGAHRTKILDDDYMGSGIAIANAIQKYGVTNFTKTILHECKSSKEMYEKEAEIVNRTFVESEMTYNLKIGGNGGFDHIRGTTPVLIDGKIIRIPVDDYRAGSYVHAFSGSRNGQYGKSLSESHREKMKKTIHDKGLTKGEKNPSYGKIWISNLNMQTCKKINKTELSDYIENGWIRGRKYGKGMFKSGKDNPRFSLRSK